MRGVVAERRRADFDIPAPLPRVCSHIRGADAGGSAICWGQWWFGARGFEAGAVNWVLDPFLTERFLLRDCACVNACNDLCWSQFSARVRPRMCERTFRMSGRPYHVTTGFYYCILYSIDLLPFHFTSFLISSYLKFLPRKSKDKVMAKIKTDGYIWDWYVYHLFHSNQIILS